MTGGSCTNCGQSFDDSARVCPYCRASAATGGLARKVEADRLDRAIAASLMARHDADVENLLTRDLGGPLSLGELRSAATRIDHGDPSLAELESALSREATIALDGVGLSELIGAHGADLGVVRRGVVFLKNRRWREALEWWGLHRESLGGAHERRELLFLLLEAFTHRLAGDPQRAAEVRVRIGEHPLFRRAQDIARR